MSQVYISRHSGVGEVVVPYPERVLALDDGHLEECRTWLVANLRAFD